LGSVLITKALVEKSPKFANCPPVNPHDRKRDLGAGWKGASGLATDVRYYCKWMREQGKTRIGHLHPKVILLPRYGGCKATAIAWLWARTVT
jgi:putative DNA methylase